MLRARIAHSSARGSHVLGRSPKPRMNTNDEGARRRGPGARQGGDGSQEIVSPSPVPYPILRPLPSSLCPCPPPRVLSRISIDIIRQLSIIVHGEHVAGLN